MTITNNVILIITPKINKKAIMIITNNVIMIITPNQADLLWIPSTSDYNLHKAWLKVFTILSFEFEHLDCHCQHHHHLVMQGNFEKLTREELVIF